MLLFVLRLCSGQYLLSSSLVAMFRVHTTFVVALLCAIISRYYTFILVLIACFHPTHVCAHFRRYQLFLCTSWFWRSFNCDAFSYCWFMVSGHCCFCLAFMFGVNRSVGVHHIVIVSSFWYYAHCLISCKLNLCETSLRVPRAETRLTVYRPLQVTRRGGLSSLKSNTLWASGHVEWQFRRKLCGHVFRKGCFFSWKNQIIFAGYIFPT